MVYLETGINILFIHWFRSIFNYILKILELSDGQLPLFIGEKLGWFKKWGVLFSKHNCQWFDILMIKGLKGKQLNELTNKIKNRIKNTWLERV